MYQCEREIVMRWSYKELRRNPLCAFDNFNEVVDALVRLATAEWWSYPEEGPTANRQPPALRLGTPADPFGATEANPRARRCFGRRRWTAIIRGHARQELF